MDFEPQERLRKSKLFGNDERLRFQRLSSVLSLVVPWLMKAPPPPWDPATSFKEANRSIYFPASYSEEQSTLRRTAL